MKRGYFSYFFYFNFFPSKYLLMRTQIKGTVNYTIKHPTNYRKPSENQQDMKYLHARKGQCNYIIG